MNFLWRPFFYFSVLVGFSLYFTTVRKSSQFFTRFSVLANDDVYNDYGTALDAEGHNEVFHPGTEVKEKTRSQVNQISIHE